MASGSSSMRDFKIIHLLGKGSYGSVYKCKRKSDGHLYAVKEVNIRKLSSREREDAVNEIRVMASIKHDYIVRYRDAFVERDCLYIVMEFAEHGDVHRLIKKFKQANRYVKEDTVWSYFLQVCLALSHLHSRSTLHRDIKPKNIFLAAKNHIRLGDLGCAKLMKTGLARTQIGTPYYMSPEIWSNRPYDDKSDMWAVGCFVFELCMLEPPFLASDMKGLARKVRTSSAPKISKHYSSELRDLVSQLLDKNPRSRPSADQVLAMACARSRLHLLPIDADAADSSERARLLATIKMPPSIHGLKHRLDLPAPAYSPAAPHHKKPSPSSSSSAAGGGGGGRGRSGSVSSSESDPKKKMVKASRGLHAADAKINKHHRPTSPLVSPAKKPFVGGAPPSRGGARPRSALSQNRAPPSVRPVAGAGRPGAYVFGVRDPVKLAAPPKSRPESRGGRPASRYALQAPRRPGAVPAQASYNPIVGAYARPAQAYPRAGAGRRFYY